MKVRRRRFLTRHQTLRLRWVVVPALLVIGFGLVLVPGTRMASARLTLESSYQVTEYPVFQEQAQAGGNAEPLPPAPENPPPKVSETTLPKGIKQVRHFIDRSGLTTPRGPLTARETIDQQAAYRRTRFVPEPKPPRAMRPIAGMKKLRLELDAGDTLTGILTEAGLARGLVYSLLGALSEVYDVRAAPVGTRLEIYLNPEAAQNSEQSLVQDIYALHIRPGFKREYRILKGPEGSYNAEEGKVKLEYVARAGQARIRTSLFAAALEAGIPNAVTLQMIRVYSWDVDFQRDIRPGAHFKILYEVPYTEDGEKAGAGRLIYADLEMEGVSNPVHRFRMDNGRIDYFEPDGQSVRKALLKTVVEGAWMSSGYGMRKHPVLGYSMMHKGLDFAAPIGTPVYAAGDGVIERIGRWGSFGNYLRIRHNNGLKTAYAHLNDYKEGLKRGDRVEQGDVVAYVGNTGRSTGPHLHYEVHIDGQQVNPSSIDLPTGITLAGSDLERFRVLREKQLRQLRSILPDSEMRLAEN